MTNAYIAEKMYEGKPEDEKEEDEKEEDETKHIIIEEWFAHAKIYFQQEIPKEEFMKAEKDAKKIFKNKLSTALGETTDVFTGKYWHKDHIYMGFGCVSGYYVRCDSPGLCWYTDHPDRIGEFDGTTYRLRFSDYEYLLCDKCYENGGAQTADELFNPDGDVKDFCKYMREKWTG